MRHAALTATQDVLPEKLFGAHGAHGLQIAWCAFFHAGKVHGSLARAGKVRGQTPKVQKQDKKKQVLSPWLLAVRCYCLACLAISASGPCR